MPKWLQTNWRWLVWTAVSLILYVLLFSLLFAYSGPPGALLVIPVFLIAWRYGWLAGLFSSLALSAANYALVSLVGLDPTAVSGQLLGTVALIIVGGVGGWISDLTRELKALRDRLSAQLMQQQAALTMSEQLFAIFMEQTPALAFIKDAHGRLQYANSAMKQTMITAEWQGKDVTDYLHPVLAAQAAADDQQAMQQGAIVVERQLPDQNGEMRTYRTHKFVIRQGDRPPLLGGLAIDITERKQMEDALRASEEQFRKAFHTIPIAMGIQRADSGHFQDVNEAFIQLSGYGREEMIGHTSRELNMWVDVSEQQSVLSSLRQGGRIRDYEIRFRHKTGEEGAGILTAEKLEINGVDCYLLSVQDVTRRKQAEMLLATYTRELERSNSALQEFAYVASHDLQEPLRKIQSFGNRLQTRYGHTLDAPAQDYLERMTQAAARMQRLITDLLTYSRVTTEAQPFCPVDLNEVVQGVLSDLEVQVQQSEADVLVGRLPTIEADPTQMRQLLQNLLSNGLKYRQPDRPPCIRITAETIEQNGRAHCQLFITDNGIGFEEKYAERIFGIFQRLHGRHEYEGSGVGLAICKKIVERHGGTITAHSQVGQGATFVVTLPMGA